MQEYLKTLNEKQCEAVLHTGPPLLILAGAGSGKTRVITTKIAYLLEEKGFTPYSILAVTFTNKAAQEMKNRVLDLSPGSEQVMIRTFHSFGAWLLRRNSHVIGLDDNFLIYDEDDKLSLLRSAVEESTREKTPASLLKYYASCISRAKDRCLYPGDDLSVIDPDEKLPVMYKLYHDKLQSVGNVDFGDLIMRAVELLREHPEVRQRIRQRFRVILVDEFQDSNPAQLELLKELYDTTNYLCVVGDEDQSIYKFRGAEVKNIVEFPEIFPGTEVVMLEQNYRSTPNILDVALSVVNHNEYRMGKNLWTRLTNGEPVKLAFVQDQDAEAMFCAEVLQDLNLSGTAILYRNNYQSRAFETLFQKIGLPYRIVGSLRFYEREEIKDILCWLHLLLNPRDEVAFARIINKPARGLGDKSIAAILEQPGRDLIACCRAADGVLPKRAAAALRDFINLYDVLAENLAKSSLAATVEKIYRESGLLDYYKEKDKLNYTAKAQNLYELVNAASAFPAGSEGLAGFLDTITLSGNEEESGNALGQVTLITIHNTKGLEFDRVIITGLEDGLFPHESPNTLAENDEDIEEERRLFYVAITRARKQLYLSSCRYRRVFGEYKERYPSRFLAEIPEKLIETLGQQREKDEYQVGEYVRHGEYGAGVITSRWYEAGTQVVLVQFENGKTAQLLPRYSHLERIYYD